MNVSTDISVAPQRASRESASAKRALRFYYLLAAPGAGMFGASVFALFSWLALGMKITPVEAGTLAMLAFLSPIFLRLPPLSGWYGSLPGSAVVFTGYAVLAAGTAILLASGSLSGSVARLILLGVPLLAFSLLHSMLSMYAKDRLDAILPGPRGMRFRETLRSRAAAVSIASLLVAGIFLNFTRPERFSSYALIFIAAILLLFQAYLFLKRIPRVPFTSAATDGANPFPTRRADGNPSALIALLDIAAGISAGAMTPFLLVFMVSPQHLGLPLSMVALYVAFFPAFAAPGRIFWGWAGERFGARPVLQITIPLLIGVLPLFSLVNTGNSIFLAPLLGLSGFLFAGVGAGLDRAFWTAPGARNILPRVYTAHGVHGDLAFALAPFAAGLALSITGTGEIQTVVLAAAAALALTIPLLLSMGSRYGMSLHQTLRMAGRGNPFLFAWNALLILRARSEEERERALRGLGRSGNPLAVPHLLKALGDPSPNVRGNAISALGRIRVVEAAPALMKELEDRESDMRGEAAEALGKIGDRSALPLLLGALGDRDIRLRNTAITALAEMGGDDIRERLFELFVVSYDTDIFPTLADSLSRLGSTDIVEPVMRCLGEYRSPILRLQFLNAVCRALGAGNTFYRILSRHEYARVDEVNRLIKQASRHVRRSPLFRRETAAGMNRILGSIAESYRSEDYPTFLRSVWEFMAYMQLVVPDLTPSKNGIQLADWGEGSPLRPYIEAVNRYLLLKDTDDIRDEGMVFLTICIKCLLEAVG